MTSKNLRRVFAIGTGIGIQIGTEELRVSVVRVRPSGTHVLGSTVIERFRQRPAAEWGAEYASFLNKAGGGHLAATVLLPRSEVIVRQLAFPGVADRDLPAAISFEVDSLHPYTEEETVYGWTRAGKTNAVMIGIARRTVVEHYSHLFSEAGIKVSAVTFSASASHSALRLLTAPSTEGFLAFTSDPDEIEFYGESPARPVFSATFPLPADRAVGLAASELRLPPDSEPVELGRLLPQPKTAPAEYDLCREALPYATALAGAAHKPAPQPANLLPPEYRSSSSRTIYIPTAMLLILLLVLAGALTLNATLGNRRYLDALRAETARVEPQASEVADLNGSIKATRERIRQLDDFRLRTQSDMDSLNELSELLLAPTWLNLLELTRNSVVLGGEAEEAAGLLKIIDSSPLFRNSEFALPMARSGDGRELFRIRSTREREAQ